MNFRFLPLLLTLFALLSLVACDNRKAKSPAGPSNTPLSATLHYTLNGVWDIESLGVSAKDVAGHSVLLLSEIQYSSLFRTLKSITPQAKLFKSITSFEATLRDNKSRYDLLLPKLPGRLSKYTSSRTSLELLYTALVEHQKLEESLNKATQKLATSKRISNELRDIVNGRARTPSSSQERTLKAWLRGDYDTRLLNDDNMRFLTIRCREELAKYEATFSATLRNDIDEASMVSDAATTQVGRLISLVREADSIAATISKLKEEMANVSDRVSFSEADLKSLPSVLATVCVGPAFSFQKVTPGLYFVVTNLEHSDVNRMWMLRVEINGNSDVTLKEANRY